jgi:dTDP-glucose 4,6-dehydratase
MKNILVTGGAGFIGSNFIQFELQKYEEIHIFNLDALTYAGSPHNLENLPDKVRYHFIHGDIRDRDLVCGFLEKYKIDTLVHFAAETHVDRSINNAQPFIDTNIQGTFSLLEACQEYFSTRLSAQDFRFHHISTDEVFGSLKPTDPPFLETTPYAPNSPYAASKAASDHLVRAFHHTYGLPVTVSNCSNNYGPFQFPEKLIPLVISNALAGKVLPVYGDGLQVRDWLFVEDHCEAIDLILRKGRVGETYNIGGNNQPANIEIVRIICQILDRLAPSPRKYEELIKFVKDRPGHDRRYAMNIEKIKRELGWVPRESLETGLHKTVAWYLNNQDWVHEINNRPDFQSWVEKNYSLRKGIQ